MEKTENKENGLIQSQRSLYTKFKRINRLFKIHISSLTLLFLLALGYIILWTYLVFTGQTVPELAQIYGLFGTIVTILIASVLSLLIIQIGIQIIFLREKPEVRSLNFENLNRFIYVNRLFLIKMY